MKPMNLFKNRVEVDEKATKNWYKNASKWGCECGHCRNFLALAESRQLPSPLLEVLSLLDIPPEKATYVCELYPRDTGHCYQFSYRIAGRVLDEAAPVQYSWGMAGCTHEPYPYGAPDFPCPNFDLEFSVVLPLILKQSENQ